MDEERKQCSFRRKDHILYFVHNLKHLPKQYTQLDTNRLTLVHFAIQSLDILGFFEDEDNFKKFNIAKQPIITWIYNLLTLPTSNDKRSNQEEPRYWENAGFKGGTFLGGDFDETRGLDRSSLDSNEGYSYQCWKYDYGHIAMTYTALCTLITLGDDLRGIDKQCIMRALKGLQLKNGSFQCISVGSEYDMRFLYCACAICYLLDDWGGIDKAKAIQYIRNCRSFDGGFSLIPGQEGHGGSTFCAVASLTLMGEMDSMFGSEGNVSSLSSWRGDLIRWCVSRQVKGLQGRPNKHEDTCYSYWIGGTLRLLDCDHLLNRNLLDDFVLECQTDLGGFSKLNGGYHPDLLHSFYSLAWLSLSCDRFEDQSVEDRSDDLNLKPFECALGICRERLKAIKSL